MGGSKSAILTIEELKVTLDTNMDQLEAFVRSGDIPQFIDTAKVPVYLVFCSSLFCSSPLFRPCRKPFVWLFPSLDLALTSCSRFR